MEFFHTLPIFVKIFPFIYFLLSDFFFQESFTSGFDVSVEVDDVAFEAKCIARGCSPVKLENWGIFPPIWIPPLLADSSCRVATDDKGDKLNPKG